MIYLYACMKRLAILWNILRNSYFSANQKKIRSSTNLNIKAMKRILLLYCLSFAFLIVNAQQLQEASPESVGLSSKQLAHIDGLCQEYLDNNWLPGGTILVARKGKIAYFKTWGNRDTKSNTPYQKDDIFRLASMTKAFTSVAMLQLLEQGKYRLDEPVSMYIPAFAESKVLLKLNAADTTYTTIPVKNPITIRHLMTHTSGLSYAFMDARIKAIYEKNGAANFGLSHETITTAEMVQRIAEQPLLHHPGERWTYGYNTDVLGYLVEVLSGQTLGVYCKEHIFGPLGMKDTGFYLPKEKTPRLVPVYYDVPEKKQLLVHTDPIYNYPFLGRDDHFAGGGGASSTTLDYAIFCQMLLNGGTYNGKRILSKKTTDLLATDQLAYMGIEPTKRVDEFGTSYGLGISLKTKRNEAQTLNSAGTLAWGGIFNTKYWINPKEELVFVGMTQILPDYHPEFWEKLYNIIYAAVE